LGLRMRTQLIAVVATDCLLVVWIASLGLAIAALSRFHLESTAVRDLVFVLSPIDVVRSIQKTVTNGIGYPTGPLGHYRPFVVHFALYAGLWFLLRHQCLRNSDRRLGRIPQPR
jgi:hypothetical protein